MSNILTVQKAANALRVDTDDPRLLDLLPQVDELIKRATGRDWAQDNTKNPVAISAATMLLVMFFENPGQIGEAQIPFALTAALTQQEAEALKYRKVKFYGVSSAGGIAIDGACVGDDVISLVGIYGVSGSQVASFESKISIPGQIQQTSGSDLSDNLYVVILKSPEDDVIA